MVVESVADVIFLAEQLAIDRIVGQVGAQAFYCKAPPVALAIKYAGISALRLMDEPKGGVVALSEVEILRINVET